MDSSYNKNYDVLMIGRGIKSMVAFAVAATVLTGTASAHSPGSMDTSFGLEGLLTLDRNTWSYTSALSQLPDGRLLVAGAGGPVGDEIALSRLTNDGQLDPTFGFAGTVRTAIGPATSGTADMVIQPDGKIIVVGNTDNGANYDIFVVRYNANGSLDTTFDGDSGSGNGIVTTAIGSGNDFATAVALQSDGKIVVGGHFNNGNNDDFVVVRYNANGSLDTTFDGDSGSGNGIVTTAIGTTRDTMSSISIDSAGRLVAAGTSYMGNRFEFVVVRYNQDGSLDTTFDADGKASAHPASFENYALDMVLQPDDGIIVGGSSDVGSGQSVNFTASFVRFDVNGALDPSFGSNGIVTTPVALDFPTPRSIALQSDARILAVGSAYVGNQVGLAVVRYNQDGSLDTSFGADGISKSVFLAGSHDGTAVVVQADGKIVTSVSVWDYSQEIALVARFHHRALPPTTTVSPTTTLAPVAAAALTGAPSPLAYRAANKRVTLRWRAVDGAASYVVTTTAGAERCDTTTTSCVIPRLRNGKAYTYLVYSVNADGVRSETATRISARPGFVVKRTSMKAKRTLKLSSIVTTPSKGAKTWRVTSGGCRIQGDRLVAPTKRGTCRLRLATTKRGSYPAMSTTIKLTITR